MIIVERATEDDLSAILDIDGATVGDHRRADMLMKAVRERRCTVARIGEQRVGFALVDPAFFGQHFIALLVVHPSYRRQGVATALLGYIEKTCPKDRLFTSTSQSNVAMHKLCEKLGFVQSGHIENLDEDDPEIIYYKRLAR